MDTMLMDRLLISSEEPLTAVRIKNQGNWISPEEHNNFLVTNPKEMEINKLPGKELKILISITFGHTAWHVEA